MISMVEIAPNAVLTEHSHSNEQSGVVLQGELDFTIGDETQTMRQGDGSLIPGDVPHSLVGSDGWALIYSVHREKTTKLE